MTKPAAARTKTDAQLAAEEEREAKAAEKRRLDPDAPFVSVSSARLAAVVSAPLCCRMNSSSCSRSIAIWELISVAHWLVAAVCLPACSF
jgi:hypothetical protein